MRESFECSFVSSCLYSFYVILLDPLAANSRVGLPEG